MYYDRVLSSEESLYVSRAQQRIAALSFKAAKDSTNNDLDEYNIQLIKELQYSIEVLRSTFLDWTSDDIRMMMDYYTLRGELVEFAFRSIVFNAPTISTGCCDETWATVPQLREVETNSQTYDAFLLSLINQEIIDRADYDAYILSLIGISSGGALLTELTADITLGGIIQGTVFPVGTLLETIWNQLLSETASISNFTFDSFTPVIEAGVNLSITEFTWDVQGSPTNLTISDSKGAMVDVAVTGTSHAVSLGYNWSINETLTWTISGDNIEDVTITVERVYPSYYGKEVTATDDLVTVTEAKILAGTKYVIETADNAIITPNTSTTEQAFIAVPKAQTVTSYTKWYVDNTNFSDILVGEFITEPVDVIVSGITYEVYRWGYRSPLSNQITLSR
jgi:hypothetical protein